MFKNLFSHHNKNFAKIREKFNQNPQEFSWNQPRSHAELNDFITKKLAALSQVDLEF